MDSYISLLPINKYNSKKMNRGENSDSLPIDLILEILPRLPAKSIGRFRCVSKLWRSMLSCPDFTKLFLTRSSARPRLLFAVRGDREWSFYSSPQPQNPYGKSSSLVVAADFHIKFRADAYRCIYTSGLIYFPEMWFSEDYEDTVPMICNPITGQYSVLPKVIKYRKWHNFFGFDPIDNQFKVLLMGYPNHRILTLGTGEMMWREIQFPGLPHRPCNKGICINGVLYYIGDVGFDETDAVIVCFDVRTETFKFVDSPSKYTKLINYKGKLGGIKLTNRDDVDVIELRMWVLEDVEKQEFSNYVYTLPENNFGHVSNVFVDGVTATGEIVLSTTKPSYVFYFNLERNTLICVEIQGLKSFCGVDAIVDHVEDLNLNDAKQLKSSRVDCHLKKPKTTTTTITTTIS